MQVANLENKPPSQNAPSVSHWARPQRLVATKAGRFWQFEQCGWYFQRVLINLGLRLERPFTGVSGPFGPEIPKKSRKESFWGSAKKSPKIPEKVEKYPKNTKFGLFRVFFDFLGYFRGHFCRPPKRLFSRLFWDFGPEGPGDSCKWSLESQTWVLKQIQESHWNPYWQIYAQNCSRHGFQIGASCFLGGNFYNSGRVVMSVMLEVVFAHLLTKSYQKDWVQLYKGSQPCSLGSGTLLSICLSICLSIYLSIYLSLYLYI